MSDSSHKGTKCGYLGLDGFDERLPTFFKSENPLEVILLSDSRVPGWIEEVYGPEDQNYIMLWSSSGTAL